MKVIELTQERVDAFITELTALSQKHAICIHGCGCCGSPSLFHMDTLKGKYITDNRNFIDNLEFKEALE